MPAGEVTVPVDLGETKDAFYLRADLPGVSPDDIQISATADTVTITGEIKDDTDKNVETWLRQERCAGRFQRSFALPVQIDPNKVEAHFNNGVLELVLPKSELVKPRTIRVNATNANTRESSQRNANTSSANATNAANATTAS
jgi:HSP20 family protein